MRTRCLRCRLPCLRQVRGGLRLPPADAFCLSARCRSSHSVQPHEPVRVSPLDGGRGPGKVVQARLALVLRRGGDTRGPTPPSSARLPPPHAAGTAPAPRATRATAAAAAASARRPPPAAPTGSASARPPVSDLASAHACSLCELVGPFRVPAHGVRSALRRAGRPSTHTASTARPACPQLPPCATPTTSTRACYSGGLMGVMAEGGVLKILFGKAWVAGSRGRARRSTLACRALLLHPPSPGPQLVLLQHSGRHQQLRRLRPQVPGWLHRLRRRRVPVPRGPEAVQCFEPVRLALCCDVLGAAFPAWS